MSMNKRATMESQLYSTESDLTTLECLNSLGVTELTSILSAKSHKRNACVPFSGLLDVVIQKFLNSFSLVTKMKNKPSVLASYLVHFPSLSI